MRRLIALAACLISLSGPVRAHPHVFIDVGLSFVFDGEGRLSALRVTWVYDELFSLLILEDMALDKDYDGVLTSEELMTLDGFDMDWRDGFDGDVFVEAGGKAQPLTGPLGHETAFREGKIITTHTRAFTSRLEVGEDPVIIRVYDPSFYTAYEIIPPARVENRNGCAAPVYEPDLDAAQKKLEAALSEFAPTDDLEEMGWPDVGAEFAEEVRLTCAAPS